MGKQTELLIRQFVRSGGKVLLLDEKPAYLEGEPYSYDYLISNCSLNEIIAAQPYSIESTDTDLYCTYRFYDSRPFIFVQNASDYQRYTQTFSFPEGYRSFIALGLITMKQKSIPLTVTLEKNESLLLFPSFEAAVQQEDSPIVELRFSNAAAKFHTNFITLDTVKYSKDGTFFSAPILCSDLRNQLLTERYEGDIFLRYEFDVDTPPPSMHIFAEKGVFKQRFINGSPIMFRETLHAEPCIEIADISPCIQKGINCYETILHWHQTEETYYALFGEGVTESLKNCIAYNSEIEAVYLGGHFGVYSRNSFEEYNEDYLLGHKFYIGSPPQKVTEPVINGLPFFRGELTLEQTLFLTDPHIRLAIPGDYLTAKVTINGQYAGELCFDGTIDISRWTHKGENTIQVTFIIGNRNLLGPLHTLTPEIFIDPSSFERNDIPSAADGLPTYKFRRFYSLNQI